MESKGKRKGLWWVHPVARFVTRNSTTSFPQAMTLPSFAWKAGKEMEPNEGV
jgi:hypothetical protein